ncbi:hypothetical protein B0O80DRAFT_126458 [Mortierella sp. GBAus27b]|nr:hypothetical protein B0O80DRAFT_126458 [Mortierella sp. GBAus27b]
MRQTLIRCTFLLRHCTLGLTLFPSKTYTQIVDNSFKLSMVLFSRTAAWYQDKPYSIGLYDGPEALTRVARAICPLSLLFFFTLGSVG